MATVVSVNVGLPQEVEWRGRTVRTAIWKQPVAGRVLARRLNLVGDGQGDLAGHGGEHRAIMVYQLDSYRHWADHFRRSDLVHGIFGENLTVDGLADDEVCIGDRFRIGGGIFEVTQPRVTCYRVGVRLNEPEMPALLVSHHRPGFYFRVIEEGEIGAGDRIEKIADGPERMTVAEIDALLYSPHHPVEALRRAIRIPALSRGWQSSMRALLDAAEKGERGGNAGLSPMAAGPPSWRGFRPLRVVASKDESIDIRSFELAAPDGAALPQPLPGQYVVVRLRPGADEAPVLRNYSLCGAPTGGTYTIAVKKEKGLGSTFLHDHVRAGDVLEASAPRGSFTLAAGTAPIVLLSAGVGITPLLAMLRAAAASGEAAPRDIWWFHAARDGAHHAFASEVRGLMSVLKRGHSCVLYSRPGAGDAPGATYDVEGHLTVALLQQRGVPSAADFYLCGPPAFLADLQVGLTAWPVDAARIHSEIFGPGSSRAPGVVATASEAPHLPSGPLGTGPNVTFLRSGIALRWDDRFRSLLDLAEACAVPVRWSCRSGVCHNCESGLIEGRLRYAPEPLDPPAEGLALICCATPAADVTLDL
jgi:ferredoxin-NADP reductase/MOSC domain-containing protein YiiM/ferredoxin